MSSILEKNDFSEEDIINIINSRLEESIHIEFKASGAISDNNHHKKEMSKDVSSFANSDGGIIFYGITEENHVASGVSYIDGNKYSKEWLENVITSNIQQKIDGIKIIPVRFEGDISKSIYVVKIPKSFDRPHITSDKKYYKRHNFKSEPMEEYEIRGSYLQKNTSKVDLISIFVQPFSYERNNYKYYIEAHAKNSGKYMSKEYKIACEIRNAINCGVITELNKTNYSGGKYKISSTNLSPLFPKEQINALSFFIEIPDNNFKMIIDNLEFKFFTYDVDSVIESPLQIKENMKNLKHLFPRFPSDFRAI